MRDTGVQPEVFERLGKIALIGGGKMGEAIVSGLVHGALLNPEALVIAEPSEERRHYLSETYGVDCVEKGADIVGAQTAIIAVKPQVFLAVATDLAAKESFAPERIISIAAGITTTTIARVFPATQIVRVMPNTPLLVLTGMSVVAVAEGTQTSEGELVVELFSLMGEALLIDEAEMNAATAISGSGPAYFALLTEELARAGERIGLSKTQADYMARQTLIGTARQLQLTEESPQELREAVTSPGGTTEAALQSFYAHDFSEIVAQAVEAALNRAEELA